MHHAVAQHAPATPLMLRASFTRATATPCSATRRALRPLRPARGAATRAGAADGATDAAAAAGEAVTDDDRAHMRRALELAALARGQTHPNPMVGCVVVKDGKVIGEGYHPRAGEPHAEVFALRAAGADAAGATAYVSLEPCSHYGRTPPCASALLAARVARCVVGCGDPNPLVAGRGVALLRAAGVAVAMVGGAEEAACRELNSDFMARMAVAKPQP